MAPSETEVGTKAKTATKAPCEAEAHTGNLLSGMNEVASARSLLVGAAPSPGARTETANGWERVGDGGLELGPDGVSAWEVV